MALSIPISFVRSRTEIWVMMPIIMQDTISDIATNAMSTYEMAFTIDVTDEVISEI